MILVLMERYIVVDTLVDMKLYSILCTIRAVNDELCIRTLVIFFIYSFTTISLDFKKDDC